MKRNISVAIFAVVFLGIMYVAFNHLARSGELNAAKAALSRQAKKIQQRADYEMARLWRKAAQPYFTEYDKGKFDEKYEQAFDPYALAADQEKLNAFSAEVHHIMVERIWRQEGGYPVSKNEVRRKLEKNPVVARINAVWDARYAVVKIAHRADSADAMAAFKEIESEFKKKKTALEELLR